MNKNTAIAILGIICLALAGYIVNDLKQDQDIAASVIEQNITQHFDDSIAKFQNDLYKKYSELYREYKEDVYLLKQRVKSLENRISILESRPSINTGISIK